MAITHSLLTDGICIISILLVFFISYLKKNNLLYSLALSGFTLAVNFMTVYILLPMSFNIFNEPYEFSLQFFMAYFDKYFFEQLLLRFFPPDSVSPFFPFLIFSFSTYLIFPKIRKFIKSIILCISLLAFNFTYITLSNYMLYHGINKHFDFYELIWCILGYLTGVLSALLVLKTTPDLDTKLKISKKAKISDDYDIIGVE